MPPRVNSRQVFVSSSLARRGLLYRKTASVHWLGRLARRDLRLLYLWQIGADWYPTVGWKVEAG